MSNTHSVEIQTFKKRTGLLSVKVKSNHMIRVKKDGKQYQFEVKDVASDLYKNCTKVVVCLTTGELYANYGELVAATPPNDVLRKNDEAVLWAYWSTDTLDYLAELEAAEREYQIAKSKNPKAEKRAVLKPEVVDYSQIIGLLAESQE